HGRARGPGGEGVAQVSVDVSAHAVRGVSTQVDQTVDLDAQRVQHSVDHHPDGVGRGSGFQCVAQYVTGAAMGVVDAATPAAEGVQQVQQLRVGRHLVGADLLQRATQLGEHQRHHLALVVDSGGADREL